MRNTRPLLMFILITVLTSFSCSKEDIDIHIQTDLTSSEILEPIDTVAWQFLMEKKRWVMEQQARLNRENP